MKLFKRKQETESGPRNQAKAAAEPAKPAKAKRSNPFQSFVNVLNGNVLTREDAVKHLPFLLFLATLCLVYIANGYLAEGAVRSIHQTENELKELRSEHITIKSDLMFQSKQSQVARILSEKEMGLTESVLPPQKIVVAANRLKTEKTD